MIIIAKAPSATVQLTDVILIAFGQQWGMAERNKIYQTLGTQTVVMTVELIHGLFWSFLDNKAKQPHSLILGDKHSLQS